MSSIHPVTPPLDPTHKLTTLELKNGLILQGYSFGADAPAAGELVFQTGMVGYSESITDPSYEGQILVMTYPLIGNYGVADREAIDPEIPDLPQYFESNRIHVAGLVVASYTEEYSHWLAKSSLGVWLQQSEIPAIYGVDTRMLTQVITREGSLLARIAPSTPRQATRFPLDLRDRFTFPQWLDPNVQNLVARVSRKEIAVYSPPQSVPPLKKANGEVLRILALDLGMKYNQIRCFVRRGAELTVVPWDYDFDISGFDGLFISNGPGDPSQLGIVIDRVKAVLTRKCIPVFGICLGHQVMALAAGATTHKLKFGNRGHNIPATNMITGRCYITSQNHGYAVDATSLPKGWKELFVNANDGTNEGIFHESLPYFSVQFHPESIPGPRDTEFLFDTFLNMALPAKSNGLAPVTFESEKPPSRLHCKKVLILGSGGLSIGQAGEFDYSGSQAIKALKEEGIFTILVNPNIATIQTSKGLADKVYFLPVNPDFVRKVIKYEQPDGIYVTFGGQTALNVGIALKDEFASLGVKVLGTQIETIITTEDRELFARAMDDIGESCAKSKTASNLEEAKQAATHIGYPVIIRTAYALGGLGSGFAETEEQLADLCAVAFASSPQVLVEKSMKGWKEIEYEVVRDSHDNCITVCNMENFDPLGIHTGDSIVVAPSQSLSEEDYFMLRTTALRVIRHLGVVGECNIQYALNPQSKEYCIIEVNARLSRSSALASKATGYPLAFVAAKLGLNIPLSDITNSVTKSTCACFEPSLDYIVVKIPRWDLKKFTRVSKELSSSMKSVGEVMSIGRSFEEAVQKAIRSVDYSNLGFSSREALMSIEIDTELQTPSDQRLFAIANALEQGYSIDKIWLMTKIDRWFLYKLRRLIEFAGTLKSFAGSNLSKEVMCQAKQLGFDDRQIAQAIRSNELKVRDARKKLGITPFVKRIDTVAAEFPACTNYLYMTYNATTHDVDFSDHGIMVLGSGVYRIGSSVEFDWCAVRAVRTLRQRGSKTIMINYNPETVSTDYDEADRLYFEVISLERVLDIYDLEASSGVVVSMGGQTSNNIALALHRQNVKILGTSPDMIDRAENRYKFSRMLDSIGVDQPEWRELTSVEEAEDFAERVGFPVLVRPSYVLSGAAMNTAFSKDDLENYLKQAVEVSQDYPVVITKYIENAKEIEMDAVAKDGQMIMHVVSEHVENAGVHSGDATLVVPPQDLDPETVARIVDATQKIGNALNVTGPYNIQFIAKNNEIKVIECNVRASRSFPFVSKVLGVDLIEMATCVIAGYNVDPYPVKPLPSDYVAVKVPQFSFSRLSGADPVLGVEMASTGEVATFGRNKYEAYLKSLIATGIRPPERNILVSIGSFKEKMELLMSLKRLSDAGYTIYATAGTADFLVENGVEAKYLEVLNDTDETEKSEYSLTQYLATNKIDLYVNLPSANRFRRPASYVSKGYRTRRMAVDYAVPLVTNVKCAKTLFEALLLKPHMEISPIDAQLSNTIIPVPGGFVNLDTYLPCMKDQNMVNRFMREYYANGFITHVVLPSNESNEVSNDLYLAATQSALNSSCTSANYLVAVSANVHNASTICQASSDAPILFLPSFNNKFLANIQGVATVLDSWPQDLLVITDASTTSLASFLLLASFHNRVVHITNVRHAADLDLIRMARKKGLRVSCDVSLFGLMISQENLPESASSIYELVPTLADQRALWSGLSHIDALTIGYIPVQLCKALDLGLDAAVSSVKLAVSLAALAVRQGRLTPDDIVQKFNIAPRKILGLHKSDVDVEIDIDRPVECGDAFSKFILKQVLQQEKLCGTIERVTIKQQNVALEGKLLSPCSAMPQNLVDVIDRELSLFEKQVQTVSQASTLAEASSSFIPERSERVGAVVPASPNDHPHRLSFTHSERPQLRDVSTYSTWKITLRHNTFLRRNITSVRNISRRDLHYLFDVAQEMRLAVERHGGLDLLRGRVLATMFYEPSTRTCTSFDTAMKRLGGNVVNVTAEGSSVQKGETLQDTVRTLGSYCDAIVLRHPDVNSIDIAQKYLSVPVINGGNGPGEHPTQAFLDLFTIREELGSVNNLTITFMGDLKFGRPVHSLVQLLKHYNIKVQLVSPAALSLPREFHEILASNGKLKCEGTLLTDEILAETDVLYCTRVQKERFSSPEEYERLKDCYRVDNSILAKCKTHMCIMHPLPRVNEISEEVDFDHRAAYFRQMHYGLYVRMALLLLVIGIDF